MKPRDLKYFALAFALAVGVSACGAADGPYENREVAGTTGAAGAGHPGTYDNDIDTFLGEYIREDTMFGDNELDFDVREGLVRVTGDVDNEAERTALQNRIRRVPGVREVDLQGVRMGDQ